MCSAVRAPKAGELPGGLLCQPIHPQHLSGIPRFLPPLAGLDTGNFLPLASCHDLCPWAGILGPLGSWGCCGLSPGVLQHEEGTRQTRNDRSCSPLQQALRVLDPPARPRGEDVRRLPGGSEAAVLEERWGKGTSVITATAPSRTTSTTGRNTSTECSTCGLRGPGTTCSEVGAACPFRARAGGFG